MQKLVVVLAIALLAFIAWASHQATIGADNIFMQLIRHIPYGDKVGHFVLFGLLGFVGILATMFKGFYVFRKSKRGKVYWVALAVTVYVLVDEALQHFSPTRNLDVYDIVASLVGLFCAHAACRFIDHCRALTR